MMQHALSLVPRRGSCEQFDDFIHSGIELCDGERLLQIGHCRGILAHRLVVGDAAPLSVHRDLRAIETPMQAG